MTGLDGAAAERLLEARLSPRRREHAQRVAAEAARLAQRFGAPREKAELAGLSGPGLYMLDREMGARQG